VTVLVLGVLWATGCEPPPDSVVYCDTAVSVQSGGSSAYSAMGLWDVSAKGSYSLQAAVRMREAGSSVDGALRGFEIEVDLQGMDRYFKPSRSLKWWLPASGYIDLTGKPPARINVLPDWLAQDMARSVKHAGGWPVIYVIIRAIVSMGGDDVKCSVAVIPIEVCDGCLAPTP